MIWSSLGNFICFYNRRNLISMQYGEIEQGKVFISPPSYDLVIKKHKSRPKLGEGGREAIQHKVYFFSLGEQRSQHELERGTSHFPT